MGHRRVLVTGIGWVTPHGQDIATVFDALMAGQPAITKRAWSLPQAGPPALLAMAAWTPEEEIQPLQRVAMDPVAQLGFTAGRRALEQAGFLPHDPLLQEAGLYIGCALGGVTTLEEGFERYYGQQLRRAKPSTVVRIMPNATAAHLSIAYGIRGPSHSYSIACTSSAAAIGEGYRAIRDGHLDCVVTGGTEAMISDSNLSAWEAAGVLAREHPEGPQASARPFDRDRSGFVLGEGAAMLVLESEEQVSRRGARPLGEIVGYGASSDAFNLAQPHREGQVRAMRAALAEAAIPPEAIGYVNAHATGTRVGDVVEVDAIRETFGAHADRLAVSATKSMHGHLIGAAGALELAITVLALQRQQLPPTANLEHPDEGCDLDGIPGRGRPANGVDYALSNSFGFGGSNVSLIVRRVGAPLAGVQE